MDPQLPGYPTITIGEQSLQMHMESLALFMER